MGRWFFLLVMCVLALQCAVEGDQMQLTFKSEFTKLLPEKVAGILQGQDPETGRFGKGVFCVTDQNVMFPLAVAWSLESKDNPYYHDPKLLEAIMAAGDALIAEAKANGQWVFRKKDDSTWGDIYMPWTYSRWLRAYGLIRDAMPQDRRKRWEDALILGYTGISKTGLGRLVNIPTHHAMGLYIAGQLFSKPEWCEQAKGFMARVAKAQDPGGFWTEHYGPVVLYNFVYTDALGVYYSVSKDKTVLPALERAAEFHSAMTYPDGSSVETVDERNPYHTGLSMGNVGFTFTSEGRGRLSQQMELHKSRGGGFDADMMASFILYGEEGPAVPIQAMNGDATWTSGDDKALIRRKGKWFVCLSAYHCPVPTNRWIQDRQNLVSIFHDGIGLIVGGGNTKMQPLWSNFTVGDVSLLQRKPGEIAPTFTPPDSLVHIPSGAALEKADPVGLLLNYGSERCEITVDPVDDSTVKIHLKATTDSCQTVAAHLTLFPHIGKPFSTEGGVEKTLNGETFTLSGKEIGTWIEHAGWRLTVPDNATITWPVLPHNPYVKDGSAKPAEGRIVVTLPFSKDKQDYVLTLTVI